MAAPARVVVVEAGADGQSGGLTQSRTGLVVGDWAPGAGRERHTRPGSAAARAGSASQPATTSAPRPAPSSSWRAASSGWPRTPGTVLAQSPAGGAARAAGAPVELIVAVDPAGNGGLGVTLVPEVLGQPEGVARHLLDGAGLGAEVVAGCDADPARAAAEPGRVWRSRPAPGAQSPTAGPVRIWVNPPDCPPVPATTTTTRGGAATSTTVER